MNKSSYLPYIEVTFILICLLLTLRVIIEIVTGKTTMFDSLIIFIFLLPVSIFLYLTIIVKFTFTDKYEIYEKGIIISRGRSYKKEWRQYETILRYDQMKGYMIRGLWIWFLPRDGVNHPWILSQIKPGHREGTYLCGYEVKLGLSSFIKRYRTKKVIRDLMKQHSVNEIPYTKSIQLRELPPRELLYLEKRRRSNSDIIQLRT